MLLLLLWSAGWQVHLVPVLLTCLLQKQNLKSVKTQGKNNNFQYSPQLSN